MWEPSKKTIKEVFKKIIKLMEKGHKRSAAFGKLKIDRGFVRHLTGLQKKEMDYIDALRQRTMSAAISSMILYQVPCKSIYFDMDIYGMEYNPEQIPEKEVEMIPTPWTRDPYKNFDKYYDRKNRKLITHIPKPNYIMQY